MTAPVFSVVIPAFNAAPYIAEALDSVADQDCPWKFEVIVVDDGSTDDTGAIVDSHRAGVRRIRQDNAGPAMARNAGVRAARADLILLLDADDRALPGRFARQVGFMLAHPEVAVSFGNWIVEGACDDYLARYGIVVPADAFALIDDPLARLLTRGSFVPTSTTAIRRAAYIDAGMQPDGLYYAEDYALWCEIAGRGGRFAGCGAPLSWYRTSAPGRLTGSGHTYAGLPRVLGGALERYRDRLDPVARAAATTAYLRAAEILLRHDWAYGGRRQVLNRLATLRPRLSAPVRRKWWAMSLVPGFVPRTARWGLHRLRS